MSKKLPFGRASYAALVGTLSLTLMVGAGNVALATGTAEVPGSETPAVTTEATTPATEAPAAEVKPAEEGKPAENVAPAPAEEKKATETKPAEATQPAKPGRTGFFIAGGPIDGVLELASDGSESFDADDTAGNDSNANNGIVRVNDTYVYRISYRTGNAPVNNFTTKVVLPKGVTMSELPGICRQPGSSLTPKDPYQNVQFPLTAGALDQMTPQTITCNIGNVEANASLNYTFTARVSNLVPQGHKLIPSAFSFKADGHAEETISNNLPSVTASSRLKWDVSKNTFQTTPDTGYVSTAVFSPCPWNSKLACFRTTHNVMLMAPNGGKGAMPGIGDVTFVDDLTPESLYPELSSEQHQRINADLEKYGSRIYPAIGNYGIAGSKIGIVENNIKLTPQNAVIDSGKMKIDGKDKGGSQPGKKVAITFENPDLSLRTSPTMTARSGLPLDISKAYAISQAFFLYTPVVTISDFGTADPRSPETKTLKTVNRFKELKIQGFNPTDVQNGDTNPDNDYRTTFPQISINGSFAKYFGGVVGVTNNTPPKEFSPGDNWLGEGLPGGGTLRDGQQTVAPTQEVISIMKITGATPAVEVTESLIACDSWDNTKLYLKKKDWKGADYDGITLGDNTELRTGWSRSIPSHGEAVWISGFNNTLRKDGLSSWDATSKDQVPAIKVQYSAVKGGNGDVAACGNDKGPWFDDPALVPGNDPAKAAQGVFTGVARVRVHTVLPPAVGKFDSLGFGTHTTISLGMEVAPGLQPGTVIPNWASVKRIPKTDGSQYNMDQVLADPSQWGNSSYNPGNVAADTFTGALGDRLIVGDVQVRINKKVRKGESGEFVSTPPQVSGGDGTAGGDIVQYQLSASLTSNATAAPNNTAEVWIEDCLPNASAFVSASVQPTLVSPGAAPADAKYKCKAGDTYIRWVFPDAEINKPIEPIIVTTEALPTAASGSYANKVQIWAAGDRSPIKLRSSEAPITITNPAGMKLAKIALTPVLQVNAANAAHKDIHKWNVRLVNNNEPGAKAVSDPVVIDVLPKRGLNETDFDGDFTFVEATAKNGEQILYTKAESSTIKVHASDSSNQTGGATTWCDAPAGGNAVINNGECPANAAEVTGLYVKRPGVFSVGQTVEFDVAMVGTGNKKAESYINAAGASATGLLLPIGPIKRKETTIAGSIGDRFFIDANGNGLYEDGEPAVAGADVRLTGTDDLGNPVDITVQTKPDGTYVIPNLRASNAAGYNVTFTIPADKVAEKYEFTTTKAGQDGTKDSDPDGTGLVANVVLKPGEDRTDIDAGIVKPAIDLVKTANKDEVRVGDVITYTFTATNTGSAVLKDVALTEESFTNGFGQAITLDAQPVVDTAASTGTVTALAPGQKVVWTANYTVKETDLELGTTIDNTAKVDGKSPRDTPVTDKDTKRIPPVDDGTYKVSKTADPANGTAVIPGQKITYTIKVTHVGNLKVNGASLEDNLPAVLTDADYNNDAVATTTTGDKGTVTFEDNKIKWNGNLVKGQVVTITYSVNAKVGTANAITNVVAPTNPKGSCDDTVGCTTNHTFTPGTYTVKKEAAVRGKTGTEVLSADVIDYTVTIKHTGGTKVTAATFTDNLANILDDAELVGAPVITPTTGAGSVDEAAKTLTWAGDLLPGDLVRITYSVRVNGNGNLDLINTVTPGDNGGTCEDGPANCTTTHTIEKGKYTYAKTSATAQAVKSGDKINYTITVKHASGDRVKGASIKDDFSEILNNATYNNDVKASAGNVAVVAGVLDWTGDLAIGDVVTIEFSVTVDANGAAELVNAVTSTDPDVERHNCEEKKNENCTTTHTVEQGKYTFSKTADLPEKVTSGQKITYTLKVNHASGDRVKGASIKDDFTALLANATYNQDATLVSGPGAIKVDGNVLTWTGDLAPRDAVVIKFSVTVDANGAAELVNAVISEDPVKTRWECAPEGCTTRHTVEGGTYKVAKASAVKQGDTPKAGTSVVAGEKLVYTLTINHATGDRVKGASITDDFTKVLTDGKATYNNDATATAGKVEVKDGVLKWTGDLAIGASVTITFSLDVNADTAVSLVNTVTPGDPRGTCTPAEVCTVTNDVPLGKYTYSKISDPASTSVVKSGDKINYTITVKHQEGTRVTGASIVDELDNVLQNARYNDDVTASSGTVSVENGNVLKWNGDLAIGQVVTIRFSVTVDANGAAELVNAVTSLDDKPRHSCDDKVGCEVRHTVEKGKYTYSKTSTTPEAVKSGDKIDYTITVKHASGDRVKGASIKDDLTNILMNASYNDDVVASAGKVEVVDNEINWTGDLAIGDEVTIKFSVTVDALSDATLTNAVLSTDPDAERHNCVDKDEANCVTVHKVEKGIYNYSKTSEPVSGSKVKNGDQITYTIKVNHVSGDRVKTASIKDDLTKVLAHATYNNDAKIVAGDGALEVKDGVLTWTGDLAVDASVTITYSVTVKTKVEAELVNVVTSEDPLVDRHTCNDQVGCKTVHNVVQPKTPLPKTGSDALALTVAAATLAGAGALALVVARRRRHS
ncbi:MAG: SdrD B-like domain-containing protein [Actinomycetaceae bacterium]|nr:SdrD B-like domain-containing protein [Actinomycetaceae bacterium]